jgi:polyisoprenoid-binding protein YceI
MSDNSSNNSPSAATLIPASMTGVWRAGSSQSAIAFTVSQMFVGKLRGSFADFDVTIDAHADPSESTVSASIRLSSVSTGNATRDHHVQSAGYFDAEKYPVAEYRSTEIVSHGAEWLIDGLLTLHGVTRPLQLTVASPPAVNSLASVNRARFAASGEFNRRDFGISTGIPIVGDRVVLSIELDVARQK